ncbi:nucleoside transporter family [Sphaerosporella brunnea]|uniref:Nucleoside transporter family n=1 Tax=Sphaerosporella brunnea TaxID=1250544 RepID=A0A5J5ES21_9PEZI|nr:nucleoside transporter family [Sphaerosporella brunnea]
METTRSDDLKKSSAALELPLPTSSTVSSDPPSSLSLLQRIGKWEDKFGVEERGIERVPPEARTAASFFDIIQIGLTWLSINLVASNSVVGILGPQAFHLSFKDSALVCLFANIAGALGPAYIAGFGPKSGNRTLVLLRFVFGWWPAKFCAILQLIGTLGYGLLTALITGQILSAVADGRMTVIVGIIITSVVVLLVCIVGMKVFHVYERYSIIPSLIVFFILAGVAGPNFDLTTPSAGTPEEIRGNRVSFFFVVFNTSFIWAMCAADYFVYYPEQTSRVVVGSMTHLGLFLGLLFSELIGAGLAAGAVTKASWKAALASGPGGLMVEAFVPLGGFGKFCAVIFALGPVSNVIPGVYSSAMAWQVLSRGCEKVPRTVWTIFGIIVYTVCAIAGRNKIFSIFENFLPLMGYWVAMWCVIQLEDEVFFHGGRNPYKWDYWNEPGRIPLGIAATTAFLIGWAGAILSMYQAWWEGPIASKALADLGVPVSAGLVAILYPPLRWLELKWFER